MSGTGKPAQRPRSVTWLEEPHQRDDSASEALAITVRSLWEAGHEWQPGSPVETAAHVADGLSPAAAMLASHTSARVRVAAASESQKDTDRAAASRAKAEKIRAAHFAMGSPKLTEGAEQDLQKKLQDQNVEVSRATLWRALRPSQT